MSDVDATKVVRRRGRPPKADPDVTPQHKHRVKLKEEEKERKLAKPTVVSKCGEKVISPFNRLKYRSVTRMSDGNVWRTLISKEEYEALPKLT
jgi:hypothetical protein